MLIKTSTFKTPSNAILLLQRGFSTENQLSQEDKVRDQLLKASFIHAKTYGFNDACINAACKDLGLSSVS